MRLAAAAFTIVGVVTAPHMPAQSPWPTYAVAEAPSAFRPAIQRGDLLIISLPSALLSELRRELDANGPVGAAGRTSARLRNPTNKPRPWAAAIVARYADARAQDAEGFVVDLGDRLGLLRPIAEQSICAPCHGPESKLDRRVVATLPDRYPADRATGYANGAMRGWFWVEVPKQ